MPSIISAPNTDMRKANGNACIHMERIEETREDMIGDARQIEELQKKIHDQEKEIQQIKEENSQLQKEKIIIFF